MRNFWANFTDFEPEIYIIVCKTEKLEYFNQSIKLVYFVAANNNFTSTEKQKIIRKQQQESCEGTIRSSSQAAFLNLNLIKSTIVIISDN